MNNPANLRRFAVSEKVNKYILRGFLIGLSLRLIVAVLSVTSIGGSESEGWLGLDIISLPLIFIIEKVFTVDISNSFFACLLATVAHTDDSEMIFINFVGLIVWALVGALIGCMAWYLKNRNSKFVEISK